MKEAIALALSEVERESNVRVLYACESGSRAWGFASKDSDYDVRFLYVHSRDWYLSIETGRDVIEKMLPGDLDVSGWELRKALRLLRKSNPPFYEWLRSPIVYQEDSGFMEGLRRLREDYYSSERCFLHYLHMAQGNIREYLTGDVVWLKKYLYVLRPMLACRWIERGLGPAPMEFDLLVEAVADEPGLRVAIRDLVALKMQGAELERAPKVPVLSAFIETELPRLAAIKIPHEPLPEIGPLNAFFRSWLGSD